MYYKTREVIASCDLGVQRWVGRAAWTGYEVGGPVVDELAAISWEKNRFSHKAVNVSKACEK